MADESGKVGSAAQLQLESDNDDDTARRVVSKILAPDFAFPTLPDTAAEVMHLANLTEIDFRRVDSVVRRDPILAARVLAVANSPVYSSGRDVASLRSAMMRLGWRTLREVLWQVVAEAYIFRGRDRSRIKHQRFHAVAVAHVARVIRAQLDMDAEDAFACGLMHDIGDVLAHHVLSGDLGEDLTPMLRRELVDRVHTSVGHRLATAWALPDPVVETVTNHHQPEGVVDPDELQQISVYPRLIAAAELVARHVGLASEAVPVDPENEAEANLLASIGLDEASAEPLFARCEELQSQLL